MVLIAQIYGHEMRRSKSGKKTREVYERTIHNKQGACRQFAKTKGRGRRQRLFREPGPGSVADPLLRRIVRRMHCVVMTYMHPDDRQTRHAVTGVVERPHGQGVKRQKSK